MNFIIVKVFCKTVEYVIVVLVVFNEFIKRISCKTVEKLIGIFAVLK